MTSFRLEPTALEAARTRATALGAGAEATALLVRAARGDALDHEALAALFLSARVPTDALVEVATGGRPGAPRLETFAPLYLTNECDAACRMCGMRADNAGLARETADRDTIALQLAILHRRGMRGVAILTGEYRHGARRRQMIARAAETLRAALARGFEHVLINIGALEADEYATLLDGVPRDAAGRVVPQVTMCTFQETYHPASYARAMGTDPDNPRSDFGRRLTNFDRARDAGLWAANPGVLLGLHADLVWELLALLAHVRHLEGRGMAVYVSLPRLRKASGAARPKGVGDDALTRLVAVLAFGAPRAKVVISTRESPAMQRRLLPMIGVLTPGSPGVAPYTETGARFEVEASQFEVLDHRPLEDILREHLAAGATIDRFAAG
jgi:2-iminoacetate synthase